MDSSKPSSRVQKQREIEQSLVILRAAITEVLKLPKEERDQRLLPLSEKLNALVEQFGTIHGANGERVKAARDIIDILRQVS